MYNPVRFFGGKGKLCSYQDSSEAKDKLNPVQIFQRYRIGCFPGLSFFRGIGSFSDTKMRNIKAGEG